MKQWSPKRLKELAKYINKVNKGEDLMLNEAANALEEFSNILQTALNYRRWSDEFWARLISGPDYINQKTWEKDWDEHHE